MSTGTGATNRPNIFNEANEELYDAFAEETPDPALLDIEYSEWSDAELNAEVWDQGKVKQISSAGIFFEDPHAVHLPPAMMDSIASWKRPHEVFPDTDLTVYDPSNEDFVLQVTRPAPSYYMLQTFIENLTMLQYLAVRYGFPVEMETPSFVSNTQGEPWRPWHHIYAMCKAGKGTVHRPAYCPYGKYVLRIFYMGAWRRCVVDDRIPCDAAGDSIFPVTQVPGELWPIILTKGVLKIFFLPHFFKEMPFISLFTGWTVCGITALNKSYEEIWRRLILFTRKYDVPEKEESETISQNVWKKDSTKRSVAKDSEEGRDEVCCFVFANLEFAEGKSKKTVVVTENRDVPLVKANRRESTKPWKKIRWVYWALKRGLWTDESQLPPYRRIHCINFTESLGRLLLPDPKTESIFFDVARDEKDDISSTDDRAAEIEDWFDYNKFYDRLSSLNVYFRPSSFVSNFKVSCLLPTKQPIGGKRAESTASGRTALKPLPPPNTFFFSPVLSSKAGELPLLFCDSTTGVFLTITLSVVNSCVKDHSLYLISMQDYPKFLRFSVGSLLVERFDWTKPEQGEIIGAIKTIGCATTWLSLKPGRHVLKLWLYSVVPYVISISSNVDVVIHRGPKIRFHLKNEAERILQYINNVSNAFISLTQKFGKPELPESLREFYSIIKPGNDVAPEYLKKMDNFIETFLNCILLCLKSSIASADELRIMMQALQSLFFDPKIYCELPKTAFPVNGGNNKKPVKKFEVSIQERTLSEILSFPWSSDDVEKITLIQKVFRGYRVRLLWKCQTPARKEFKAYAERLKKICDTIFIPPKREAEVGKLLRRILMVNPDLLATFKFHSDFINAIDVQEFTGRIANVEPGAWIAIARFIVYCDSDLPVPCAFYLSCNIEQFVIQGVDNDTGEEIFRIANCISPRYYHRNGKGYTIFIHGWNAAKPKTVNWRLQIVKMKYFDTLCLCNTAMTQCNLTNLPAIEVFEVKNFYVPNAKTRISRCLIKVYKRTLLTLRFSASYSEVNFELVVKLDKKPAGSTDSEPGSEEDVIAKVSRSTGAALMPAVFLEHLENPYWGESDSDHTSYVLEAYVLNNTWPLTKHEWGVIEPFRVNGEGWRESSESLHFRKGTNESKRKFSRISRRALSEARAVENPFWLFQVVLESSGGDHSAQQMVIEEDKSFAESVKNMKSQWEEKDPGRRSRGNDIRMNFLYSIWLERKTLTGEGEGDFDACRSEDEDTLTDFNLLVRRMSSFSYLLEDTEPSRHNKSPRILPEMPTYELLFRYKKESFTNTGVSIETSTNDQQSNASLELTEKTAEGVEEYLMDFLTQCTHYREVMKNHLSKEQNLSNQLMEEAYEDRVKAIRRMSKTAR